MLSFVRSIRMLVLVVATVLGLGFGLSAHAQGGDAPARRIDVRYLTVGSHFFLPDQFMVAVGTPLRLVVTNVSRDHLHDVLIVPHDAVHIVGGRPEVIGVGEVATIEWTPETRGVYRILCAVCGEDEMIAFVYVI